MHGVRSTPQTLAAPAGSTEAPSPSSSLFESAPSSRVLSEVQDWFDRIGKGLENEAWGVQLDATERIRWKMKRVDLAIRLIHLQLCLDKEGSPYAKNGIRASEAGQARDALIEAADRGRLRRVDLKEPVLRRLLWNALGAAHPLLRIYVQGVRLAGYIDDPDVLRETLHVLRSEWLHVSRSAGLARTVEVGGPPVDGWMVTALVSLLRLQAVGEAADAGQSPLSGMSWSETLAVEALQATEGKGLRTAPDRAPAWQLEHLLQDLLRRRDVRPIRTTVASAVDAAVTGRMDNLGRQVRVAEALLRAGESSVEVWSTAARKRVDVSTDTVAETPLVVVWKRQSPDQGDVPALAVGPVCLLGSLAGRKVCQVGDCGVMAFDNVGDPKVPPTEGEYLYTGVLRPDRIVRSADSCGPAELADFLRCQGLFAVDVTHLPEGSRSLVLWAGRFQGVLSASGRHLDFHRRVLGPYGCRSSCGTFDDLAAKSSAEQPMQAFRDWFFRWGNVLEQHEADPAASHATDAKYFLPRPDVSGAPQRNSQIARDISQRSPRDASVFARHEAALGRAIQAMPRKFDSVHPRIRFRTVSEEVQIEYGEGHSRSIRPLGQAGSGFLMLRVPWVSTAVHERLHCLNSLLYGDVARLFSQISWEDSDPVGRKWVLRAGQASRTREDFLGESSATRNPSEDHSYWGEYYFAYPEWLRRHVRAQAARGNFVPALKYLYLKRITFLELNGRSLEYGLAFPIRDDGPFAIEEFRKIVSRFGDLTPEQERLSALAEEIEARAQQMIRTGKITCRTPISSESEPGSRCVLTSWSATT